MRLISFIQFCDKIYCVTCLAPPGGCDTSLGAIQKWIIIKIAKVLLGLFLMSMLITDMNSNRKVPHSCHPGSLNNNYFVKYINYILNYFYSLGRVSKVFYSPRGSLD
jgi:hypothetical protein